MTDANVHQDKAAGQSTATLIYRVKAMDQEAWGRLVHVYGPLVYRWCRKAGLCEADAADVGQEVFHAVIKRIGDFSHDGPGANFRGWLRVITRNKIADFGRGLRAGGGAGGTSALTQLAELPGPEPDSDADAAADPEDELILLRRALELVLADFNEESQRAYLMLVVERRKPADVAGDLGLTVNAVYLAKSRITRRLREEFAGVLDLGPAPAAECPEG